MNRLAVVWALLVLTVAAAAQRVAPEAQAEQKFTSGGSIQMRLAPGDYTILGTNTDHIRIAYHPIDSSTGPVKVDLQATGSQASLRVRHTAHNFHADIEVPTHCDLFVRLGVGDLKVQGVAGNKDIETHVGDLNVDVRRPEDYQHVDASVGIGDLAAPAFNVNKDGFVRSFHRQGQGLYRLHLHVGVGDLRMYETD
jgi:hypothetical protein